MSETRRALPGELCTCGRQALEVIVRADGGEVGWCGVSDGGATDGPCPFCGGDRHELGPCPQYRLVLASAWERHDDPTTDGR